MTATAGPVPVGSRLDRVLVWVLRPLIIVGIVALFAESVWQSWATLVKAAEEAEVAHPGTWPWQVDGFLVVMALIIADAIRSRGRGWWGTGGVWWARFGLVAATVLSTVVQAVYAPGDWPDGGWWLHAINAPAVLFSFECLMWLVYGAGATALQQVAHGDVDGRAGPTGAGAASAAGTPLSLGVPPQGSQLGTGRAAARSPAAAGRLPGGLPPRVLGQVGAAWGSQQVAAGVAREAGNLPQPSGRVEGRNQPVTSDAVSLAARPRAERKRLLEALRRGYRAGTPAVLAAAAHGVPADDVAALYEDWHGRYGPQPQPGSGGGNGDRHAAGVARP